MQQPGNFAGSPCALRLFDKHDGKLDQALGTLRGFLLWHLTSSWTCKQQVVFGGIVTENLRSLRGNSKTCCATKRHFRASVLVPCLHTFPVLEYSRNLF